jgi:two-component system response regulator AlgR
VCAAWPGGVLLIEESLRSLEEEFSDRFVRVHRNALAALAHIEGLDKDQEGNTVIILRDMAERLPVSRRLLGQVRKRLRA